MSESKQTGITVRLTGENGNIFNLLGIVQRELKRHGMADVAKQLIAETTATHSYEEALAVIMEYVEVE